MPVDGLKDSRDHDAIYLGAVGFPTVPDHTSLWDCYFRFAATSSFTQTYVQVALFFHVVSATEVHNANRFQVASGKIRQSH